MNDYELDRALNCLSIEPGVGFSETVMADLAELDALRELADRQARTGRGVWLAAGVVAIVVAGLVAFPVLVPPAWLVQTGQSALLALAAVDWERWAPVALLAAAAGIVASSPGVWSRPRRGEAAG
jgi:hypothetical protein